MAPAKLRISAGALAAGGRDGIDFRNAFGGAVLSLSAAVLLECIPVQAAGGAQPGFSRRQAIGQRQERFLDHDVLGGSGGDECLSYRRRASQSPAQAAELVRRGRCPALDPGILRDSLLERGTSTHGRRREIVEGKSSLARSGIGSHSGGGTESHG